MIENSMFYMNFEVSSDSQKRCVEEIKRKEQGQLG